MFSLFSKKKSTRAARRSSTRPPRKAYMKSRKKEYKKDLGWSGKRTTKRVNSARRSLRRMGHRV